MHNLARRWSIRRNDWITSVSCLPGQAIVFGTRDGHLEYLDWEGGIRHVERVHAWVGATQLIHDPTFEHIIISGTKDGRLAFGSYNSKARPAFQYWDISKYNNTIRSIQFLGAPQANHYRFVVGCEDKHIYVWDLLTAPALGYSQIAKASPNGWIRCTSRCADRSGQPLIAAGSGDKYIHFYDFDGVEQLNRACAVNAKAHALVAGSKASVLFVATDGLKFHVLNISETTAQVQLTLETEFRPLFLVNTMIPRERTIIACEQGQLLEFDHRTQQLFHLHKFESAVTSICDASTDRGPALLVGTAAGELSLYSVSPDPLPAAIPRRSAPASVQNISTDIFEDYARALIEGTTLARKKIGIGRFISVVASVPRKPAKAIVATDEGSAILLDMTTLLGEETQETQIEFEGQRAWSAYGYWRNGSLRVRVSTSASEIATYDIVEKNGSPTWTEQERIPLPEWPREIRPIVGGEPHHFVAACEDGLVRFLGDPALSSNNVDTGETLRSVFVEREPTGEYFVVVGSDQFNVKAYRGGKQIWQYSFTDRIREIIRTPIGFVAASEDRFIVIFDTEGKLKLRIQCPHRVLSVASPRGGRENDVLLAGCGNGQVYVIDKFGFVEQGFRYPDRIRDIAFLNPTEFLVACEDRNLYFADMAENFFKRKFPKGERPLLEGKVKQLLAELPISGAEALTNRDPVEIFALLDRIRDWSGGSDNDRISLAHDLIHRALQFLEYDRDMRRAYIVARAIIHVGANIDAAIARSFMEFGKRTRAVDYFFHGLISSLAGRAADTQGRAHLSGTIDTLLEHIVQELPDCPAWCEEALVNLLASLGWGRLEDRGFLRFFQDTPLPFSKFEMLCKRAAAMAPRWSIGNALGDLVEYLSGPIPTLRRACKGLGGYWTDASLSRLLDQADATGNSAQWGDELSHWFARIGFSEPLRSLLMETVAVLGADNLAVHSGARKIAGDRLWLSLIAEDPQVTANEYLALHAVTALISGAAPIQPPYGGTQHG